MLRRTETSSFLIPHSSLYFDTHTHLPDDCTDEQAEALIREASEAQVTSLLLAGTSLRDCPQNLALSATHIGVFTSVGIHPLEVKDYVATVAIPQMREWLSAPHVVAIGEIGLDNHYADSAPAAIQEQALRDQLHLAAETGTPVVIHSREAFDRCHALVRECLPTDHPLQIHSFADGIPATVEPCFVCCELRRHTLGFCLRGSREGSHSALTLAVNYLIMGEYLDSPAPAF